MDRFKFSSAMLIFGTIGCFVHFLSLPSSLIALTRGIVGTLFLALFLVVTRQKLNWSAIRRNRALLFLSGAAMGFNWILLFEAYRHTTVAVATLCYYMAPVLVIALSPLILKERLSRKKILCSVAAVVGMLLVSGVLRGQMPSAGEGAGILLGLSAAVLYTTVIFCNKFLRDIPAYDSTILQLGAAALVLLPYTLLTGGFTGLTFTRFTLPLLLFVGMVHTGIAYVLYFGSLPRLEGQTIAIYSYIDPAFSILLSVFLLGEPMDLWGVLGAALILGSTLASELKLRQPQVEHS